MRGYRCYLLASDKHIRDVCEFRSPSDDEAVAAARQYAASRDFYSNIEIWDGARLLWFGRWKDLVQTQA